MTGHVIMKEVVMKYGITIEMLRGSSRDELIVLARREIAWRARRETGLSSLQVGILMNKDHTAILHMCKRYKPISDVYLAELRDYYGMADRG